MKLKKKEDQSVDTSLLPRIGNKIPMKGVTETKFGAKMKRRTIQRLPHPGIHPIISQQTQTLLHMPFLFLFLLLLHAFADDVYKRQAVNFVSVITSMGILFLILRRIEVSTL